MEVVHTCPDIRFWCEVLCFTILTHMNDSKVKDVDLEIILVLEAKRDSGKVYCPATALIFFYYYYFSPKTYVVNTQLSRSDSFRCL